MLRPDALARLCRARDRLRDAACEPVLLAQIAKEAAFSTFHFIRLFSAVFGETPHQFRIRAQLAQARRLLSDGDFTVTEICMEVGFASVGTFSALFTDRVGVSPSVYRRQSQSLMRAQAASAPAIPGCFGMMCGPTPGTSQFPRRLAEPPPSDFTARQQLRGSSE